MGDTIDMTVLAQAQLLEVQTADAMPAFALVRVVTYQAT